jgi:hypothetical protein
VTFFKRSEVDGCDPNAQLNETSKVESSKSRQAWSITACESDNRGREVDFLITSVALLAGRRI